MFHLNKLTLLALIAALGGCASSDKGSDTGAGGSVGTGAAGSSGPADAGIVSGSGGSNGSAGSSGLAGSSAGGAMGRGGAIGAAGSIGVGGTNGVGGSIGVGGSGGRGTTGAAGSGSGSAGSGSGAAGSGSGAAGSGSGSAGASPGGQGGTTGTAGRGTGTAGAVASGGSSPTGSGGRQGGAGTTGDAGSGTSFDGGVFCPVDELRCGPTGRRQRCDATGTWLDESFVCTVQLAGSTDYKNVCAVKADGTLSCWGTANDFEQKQAGLWTTGAPKKSWVEVTVSDGPWQSCAVDGTGAVSCWSPTTNTVFRPTDTFKHYVTTIYGDCGIRTTGELACYNGTALPATGYAGKYVQLSVSNQAVYAIDDTGALHKPDFVPFPAGKYLYVSSNNGAACAVRDDGQVFCYGPAQDALPPPTDAFVQVAMDYNYRTACGLRSDGTILCWPGQTGVTAAVAPMGLFTQITSFTSGYCAIRRDGTTACWATRSSSPQVGEAPRRPASVVRGGTEADVTVVDARKPRLPVTGAHRQRDRVGPGEHRPVVGAPGHLRQQPGGPPRDGEQIVGDDRRRARRSARFGRARRYRPRSSTR